MALLTPVGLLVLYFIQIPVFLDLDILLWVAASILLSWHTFADCGGARRAKDDTWDRCMRIWCRMLYWQITAVLLSFSLIASILILASFQTLEPMPSFRRAMRVGER